MNDLAERELCRAILDEMILIANGGDIEMFGRRFSFPDRFRAEIRNDLREIKNELNRDLILYGSDKP